MAGPAVPRRERAGHQLRRSLQNRHLRTELGDRGDSRCKCLDSPGQPRIELAILGLDKRGDLLQEDDQRGRHAREVVAAQRLLAAVSTTARSSALSASLYCRSASPARSRSAMGSAIPMLCYAVPAERANARRQGRARPRSMSAKVPLLDLQAQYRPIRDELVAAVVGVCDSQRFIMGPEIEALEANCRLLGIRHAIAVSSGTDALLLALMALEIGAGDEVVTRPTRFRDGRRDRAARRASRVRGHRSRDVQYRCESGGRGDERTHEGHSAGASVRPERGNGSDPRRGGAGGCARGRGRRQAIGATYRRSRSGGSARSAVSRSSRARISARSVTPGC